ncbi:4-hydroxy-tetrahydrodipicolinate reductase [Buchnera aphidicola]|uniref:4-hydroxy-tetrahydrodipicolinate reductase n=1 Tax=Buchnera aphidicola TaxID=9 RepID=UPI00094C3E4A|nr:4-hydroxy-tetrahydrodipicolinate reductase [Buchnera aphidicola]
MKKKKTKIIISGALGRMGKMLIQEIKQNKEISLTAAIINEKSQKQKEKITSQQKFSKLNFYTNINQLNIKKNKSHEILIDFTTPDNTLNNLKYCIKNKINIIIGTTGFNDTQIEIIKNASKDIAIFFAPNFSIGINLLCNVTQYIASIIGQYTDIEIIEAHHRDKIDSPSGTALQIGRKISKTMNWKFNEHTIFQRNGRLGVREKNKIGFSTIRGGDIIGEHKVLFADIGERIEISHKATNRSTFAKGAIQAAIWIQNKEKGLFNMSDIFKSCSSI